MNNDSDSVHVGESGNLLRAVRIGGLLAFAIWVWRYMAEPGPLLHGSILIFHEAGHVLFMPFGEFMMVLGGSLFQLMVPLFFIGYFARRRDFYAVSVTTLYLVASMDNVARYIADARAGDLPLLGGDRTSHDWTYLLIELNRLNSDIAISRFVHDLAVTVFGIAVVAGLWIAWQPVTPPRTPAVRARAVAADSAPR